MNPSTFIARVLGISILFLSVVALTTAQGPPLRKGQGCCGACKKADAKEKACCTKCCNAEEGPVIQQGQGGPPFGKGKGRGGQGFGKGKGKGGQGFGKKNDPQFAKDRDTFHFLLANHTKIKRTVKNLHNGVETLTESDTPEIVAKIQEHVYWMHQRVKEVRPIHMRDPLFYEVFQHADKISMKFEKTKKGVQVVETSNDPYVAKLIQAHAQVVSRFIQFGHQEAMKNHPVPKK